MGEFSRFYKSELPDAAFEDFWARLSLAGRERRIGFDAPPLDAGGFCRWMRQPDIHAWLVRFRGETVGLCYLTQRQGSSAHVHFAMLPCGTARTSGFPGVPRLPVIRAAALFGLGAALWEGLATPRQLDTLIGITPGDDERALHFIRTLGGEEVGVAPGLCWRFDEARNVPGVITVFRRECLPAWAAFL